MEKLKEMHNKCLEGKLEGSMPLVVFIVNIIWPGLGTWIIGFLNMDKGNDFLINCLIIGWLQAFLCCIIVGWIWSIYLGHQVYKKSK